MSIKLSKHNTEFAGSVALAVRKADKPEDKVKFLDSDMRKTLEKAYKIYFKDADEELNPAHIKKLAKTLQSPDPAKLDLAKRVHLSTDEERAKLAKYIKAFQKNTPAKKFDGLNVDPIEVGTLERLIADYKAAWKLINDEEIEKADKAAFFREDASGQSVIADLNQERMSLKELKEAIKEKLKGYRELRKEIKALQDSIQEVEEKIESLQKRIDKNKDETKAQAYDMAMEFLNDKHVELKALYSKFNSAQAHAPRAYVSVPAAVRSSAAAASRSKPLNARATTISIGAYPHVTKAIPHKHSSKSEAFFLNMKMMEIELNDKYQKMIQDSKKFVPTQKGWTEMYVEGMHMWARKIDADNNLFKGYVRVPGSWGLFNAIVHFKIAAKADFTNPDTGVVYKDVSKFEIISKDLRNNFELDGNNNPKKAEAEEKAPLAPKAAKASAAKEEEPVEISVESEDSVAAELFFEELIAAADEGLKPFLNAMAQFKNTFEIMQSPIIKGNFSKSYKVIAGQLGEKGNYKLPADIEGFKRLIEAQKNHLADERASGAAAPAVEVVQPKAKPKANGIVKTTVQDVKDFYKQLLQFLEMEESEKFSFSHAIPGFHALVGKIENAELEAYVRANLAEVLKHLVVVDEGRELPADRTAMKKSIEDGLRGFNQLIGEAEEVRAPKKRAPAPKAEAEPVEAAAPVAAKAKAVRAPSPVEAPLSAEEQRPAILAYFTEMAALDFTQQKERTQFVVMIADSKKLAERLGEEKANFEADVKTLLKFLYKNEKAKTVLDEDKIEELKKQLESLKNKYSPAVSLLEKGKSKVKEGLDLGRTLLGRGRARIDALRGRAAEQAAPAPAVVIAAPAPVLVKEEPQPPLMPPKPPRRPVAQPSAPVAVDAPPPPVMPAPPVLQQPPVPPAWEQQEEAAPAVAPETYPPTYPPSAVASVSAPSASDELTVSKRLEVIKNGLGALKKRLENEGDANNSFKAVIKAGSIWARDWPKDDLTADLQKITRMLVEKYTKAGEADLTDDPKKLRRLIRYIDEVCIPGLDKKHANLQSKPA